MIISKEKLAELKSKLPSVWNKRALLRQYGIEGSCTICYGVPSKVLRYDVGDAKKVEWYCDKCFERWIKKEKREF